MPKKTTSPRLTDPVALIPTHIRDAAGNIIAEIGVTPGVELLAISDRRATGKKVKEPSPIHAMSMDHRETIFRRSRARSLNTPELALAHESLTSWLNGENAWPEIAEAYRNSPESIQRISDLLDLVRREVARFEASSPEMDRVNALTLGEEMITKLTVQFTSISRAMSDYATVPFLAFQPKTKLWAIGQWPAGLGEPGSYGFCGERGRPYGEVMAAHGILTLAAAADPLRVKSRALDRIRRCDCGRWYFAIRFDGVACSDRCRKRIHDKKPAVKAKKAKDARTNLKYKNGKIFVEKK
jgi:hypothetical protein